MTRVLRRCALSASWLAVAATSCDAAAVSSAAARAISLDAAWVSAWLVAVDTCASSYCTESRFDCADSRTARVS